MTKIIITNDMYTEIKKIVSLCDFSISNDGYICYLRENTKDYDILYDIYQEKVRWATFMIGINYSNDELINLVGVLGSLDDSLFGIVDYLLSNRLWD